MAMKGLSSRWFEALFLGVEGAASELRLSLLHTAVQERQ